MNSKATHDQSRDRKLVSEEPYEIRYVVDEFAKEFPSEDREDIKRMVEDSKKVIQPSESREALNAEIRKRLSKR